jgi:hypothetical protein
VARGLEPQATRLTGWDQENQAFRFDILENRRALKDLDTESHNQRRVFKRPF